MSDPTNDRPEPRLIALIVDRASNSVRLVRSDHKEILTPLDGHFFSEASAIARFTQLFDLQTLAIETMAGEVIGIELPTSENRALTGGRPVVYLDQKDWSTLARTIHHPDRVNATERLAAEVLIELAKSQKVILPLSSAHLSETAKWKAYEPRYQLALTMFQLSRGWQLRDPLEIRRLELNESFTRVFERTSLPWPEIITLDPAAITSGRELAKSSVLPGGFPASMAASAEAIPVVLGLVEALLDSEPVDMAPNPGWVSKNQRFTNWLAGEAGRTTSQKKASIEVFFLDDTKYEVAEEASKAGISPEQMSLWITKHRDSEFSRMPALGLFREVLFGKHLNRATSWEDNDLTDLMYLTSGAAYADFTVGERSLTSQIRQAQTRLGRPATAYRRIEDLVPDLQARLN